MKTLSIKSFLYREWAGWQAAWQRMRDERRRHETQCISVPLTRYCDLMLAEDRAKVTALRLAVSIEERVRLQAANDMLGAIVSSMTDEQRVEGIQNVARLELAPPSRRGFDS